MAARIQAALARGFEVVDRLAVDGLVNAVGLGAIAVAEALRHAMKGQLQTYVWVAMAFLVGFGIWYILRVPDTLFGIFGAFGR